MSNQEFAAVVAMITGEIPARFEEAMQQLEELSQAMEKGNLPLELSLQVYERGTQLYQFCATQLQAANERIRILEEGQLKVVDTE